MVIEKCTDVFRGIFWFEGGGEKLRGGVMWEDLSMEESGHGGREFQ